MYLELAKDVLDKEYCLKKKLATKECGLDLVEEKIVHSYQVLGAGNMILRNEEVYKSCSSEEIDKLKATLLLHDLGRFEEAVSKGIDHGVWGAGMLKNIPEFNEPKIMLTVKHHGHLIESLYEDEEYVALKDDDKEEVKKYMFLVRDADKLANFYLLSRNFLDMKDLFLCPLHRKISKDVSYVIRSDFMKNVSINKKDVVTIAEQALMILACVFDLNYRASFVFLNKMGVLEKFFRDVEEYFDNEDAKLFKKVLFDYIDEKLS